MYITYQLSSPSCSTRDVQKSLTLNKTYLSFLEKKENGLLAEKWQDRKSKMTRQKNKRRDRKRELNDSPEIPDRAGDIRHPQPPFGDFIKCSETVREWNILQSTRVNFQIQSNFYIAPLQWTAKYWNTSVQTSNSWFHERKGKNKKTKKRSCLSHKKSLKVLNFHFVHIMMAYCSSKTRHTNDRTLHSFYR